MNACTYRVSQLWEMNKVVVGQYIRHVELVKVLSVCVFEEPCSWKQLSTQIDATWSTLFDRVDGSFNDNVHSFLAMPFRYQDKIFFVRTAVKGEEERQHFYLCVRRKIFVFAGKQQKKKRRRRWSPLGLPITFRLVWNEIDKKKEEAIESAWMDEVDGSPPMSFDFVR